MKKVLAVVLTLCILVSGITTALIGGVSASGAENVFDDPANWVRYAFNTTHINSEKGTDPGWGSIAKNTNTAYTYNADASSIKISGKLQLSTLEFDVEANKDYTLSYRFLTSGAKYNSNGVDTYLVRTGIATPNGSVSWGQDGYILYMDTVKAYTAPNGVFASRASIADRTANWTDEGVWHQVNLNFNSGDNEKLKLVVQAGTDTFYLDDFSLTSKVNFENLDNWGIYNPTANGDYAGYSTVDGNAPAKYSWASIALDTKTVATGSATSVKLYGNTLLNAFMLNGLKANTKYNLTFKYFIPENSTWGSSAKAWFTPGIVKKGVAMSGNTPAEYFAKGTAPTTTAGSWYDYTLTFTTDDNKDYAFTVYNTFASGFTVYLDEMALAEAPRPTYLIQDFEDYTKSKSEYVGAISIVAPEGTSVSGTKALQYDGTAEGAQTGEGSNRFIINPSNSGLPTLGELVDKGSKFKVTFKYKLLNGEVKFYMGCTTDGASAWSHASPNPYTYKSTTLSAGDSWQEFSYEFTLKADAADGTYSYPIFFIGGVGKAYIDYVTVSTVSAVYPDVEIPSEVTPDAEGTMTFEASEVGDHLTYIEATPAKDKAPTYPEGGKWQMVSNNGYITYTDVADAKSKVANTYAETIYKADGTTAVQTPHQGRKVGGWSFENNLTVSNAVAHGGKKSLEVKSADMAYATGFNISKAGKYTITYYVNDISAIKSASGTFGSAVLSTINIAANRTGSDVYYDDATMGVTIVGQLPNHLNSGTNGKWADYTLSQFRSVADLATVTPAAGETWYQVTHTFEVKDVHKKIYLAIYNKTGANVYIDDIILAEDETPDPGPGPGEGEEPGPGEDPEPSGPSDYDDAASWKLYHSDYNAPTVNGNGVASYSWIKNSQNTDKAYTYNGGAKSIKFYGNIQFTAIRLSDLEKGKAYKVSFKYFAPTSSVVGSSSKAWVNQVGIVKGGTAMNKNNPAEFYKKGTVFAGAAGQWHEYTMLFRADSTDLYFGMGLTFGAGFTLYLDDFTVTETNEDPDAIPVVPGKEPKDKVVIDFETEQTGANASLSPNDRIEIVEAEAYDGKPSKMLHFIKGAYDSATTLNYNSTYATDTDDVFTIGVKPKKVYNLSFRVKTDAQTLPEGAKAEWIGLYFTFGKKYLISSYQHSVKRGEWLYYEYAVTTSADQNLLSFYVNAGESTPDIWIDDITITETDYEPFLGWGDEPRDEILINFDDFFVSYDIACASIVDGPERDGKITKATYLKGGSYNYNAVANYSAVTQYRDPVFTVPCKENTLYEFSYYIYVPKDTGSVSYFAVYYDWANTWVLRASGMTERDEWVKKTTRFTTKAGQTQLSLTFNGGKVIPDIYLDDICLKELKPGTLNYSNNASYSEHYYNVFNTKGLTAEVEKGKTTVIKLPVKKQYQYTFGITVESLKKSNSRVFLSLDGVNPMAASDVGAPSAVISADGTTRRYGIDFISSADEFIYLVIENDDGALKLSEPYLFTTKSLSTNLSMGYELKPNAAALSVNTDNGELTELVVFGSKAEQELIGDNGNPVTGSESVLPVILLAFTLLIACVTLVKLKKGGEQA